MIGDFHIVRIQAENVTKCSNQLCCEIPSSSLSPRVCLYVASITTYILGTVVALH